MARHIDIYTAHQLDRNRQSAELIQQLTEQLHRTDPQDSLMRGRVETARAILADPVRRHAYDAHLSDQYAEPITEEVLATMAGRAASVERVIVSPAKGRPIEFTAESWSVSRTGDGSTISLVASGNGSRAKHAKRDGNQEHDSAVAWIGGAIGATLGLK